MAEVVTISQLDIEAKLEGVNAAVNLKAAVRGLGYDAPTTEQKDTVTAFVRGKDVFVSLPTGSGKSLCYVAFLGCLMLSEAVEKSVSCRANPL